MPHLHYTERSAVQVARGPDTLDFIIPIWGHGCDKKKNPGAAFTLGSPVNGGRGGTRTHDLTDVKCISLFGYLWVHGYGLSKTMRPF